MLKAKTYPNRTTVSCASRATAPRPQFFPALWRILDDHIFLPLECRVKHAFYMAWPSNRREFRARQADYARREAEYQADIAKHDAEMAKHARR